MTVGYLKKRQKLLYSLHLLVVCRDFVKKKIKIKKGKMLQDSPQF